jgi:hypothetical protein
MTSENGKRLQQALASTLKLRGFKKAGATWRRESSEAISVLNLQGSQWGPSFYINLGVYFRALGERNQPAEHHCHIRIRLSELVPDRERLHTLLDFEKPIQEGVRGQELERLVVQHGLPWLETVSTVEGARDYCKSQSQKSMCVTKEARAFLGRYTAPNNSLGTEAPHRR